MAVEKMAISKFKATCLSVLEQVHKTGQPVLITRFGEPVAQVVPPPPPDKPAGWIGSMAGEVTIQGDIISPAAEPQEWEALAQ